MTRLPRVACAAALVALLVSPLLTASPATASPATASTATASPAVARTLPSRATWATDVRTAMTGSQDFLTERAAGATAGTLAINLDIDNTSLASTYARGRAVRPVLAFARHAHDLGYAVFFNTGRLASNATGVVAQLEKVGFTVDALCTRDPRELLPAGKQRCRAGFVAQGFTVVANVGNNRTDFVGGDYERAFVLPNYRKQLG